MHRKFVVFFNCNQTTNSVLKNAVNILWPRSDKQMFQMTPSEYMLRLNFSVWILQHTSTSKRRIVLAVSLGVFPEKGV